MMEKSLHFGIKLKKAFEDFQKIPFPKPPIDDGLYDLYSELVEFDAYIAGLISSFIKGNKINKSDLHFDEKIMEKFINFETINIRTKEEISIYINYINKLKELINMVLEIIEK